MRKAALASFLLMTCGTLVLCLAPASPAAAQDGEISGTVRDGAAQAVSGLPVRLEGPNTEYLGETTTDADGFYEFTGLADGTYLVHAASDPDPVRDLVGEYYDDRNEFDWDLATRLVIVGFAAFPGTDFELASGFSITGNLLGLLAGATVHVQGTDAVSGRFRGSTDSDGGSFTFSIDSLPAGDYKLYADPWGTDRALQWYDGRNRFDLAEVVSVGPDADVTIDLAQGTSISGTVTLSPNPGDGGATVEQIAIDVFVAVNHEHLFSSNADTSGSYTLSNLPPGSYILQAQTHDTGYVREIWIPGAEDPLQAPVFGFHEAAAITVDVATPATGIDFRLDAGRTITGHVELEPATTPVEGAAVDVNLKDGTYDTGAGTDSSGDFTFVGLPPGEYFVTVESRDVDEPFVAEQWNDKTLFDEPDPVDVTAGSPHLVFGVAQSRVISGKIFLDSSPYDQVQQAGEPSFSNVTVRLSSMSTGRHLGHAAVAPDGRYSVGVLPGLYRVEANPHQGAVLWEYWNDTFYSEDAQAVDVTAADAVDFDFGLVDAADVGTLRGRVIAADTSAGLAGVDVQVRRFENDSGVAWSTTDATGAFVVTNVPPGSFKVFFETSGSNAAADTDYISSEYSSGGNPRVDYPAVAGDGTDLGSFALALGGSISGTVFPPSGDSLPPSAGVFLEYPAGGGTPLPGAGLDGGGAYHVRGVPAGSLRVGFGAGGTDFVQVYYLSAIESTFSNNNATPVAVTTEVEIFGIDLHLERGGSISGRVTVAATTDPVAAFPISANLHNDPQGRNYWAWTQTDSAGVYTLRGLPSGDYEVRTESRQEGLANETWPGFVTVTAPLETSPVDFALEAAGTIRGRVTRNLGGPPEPVQGVRVQALDAADGRHVSDGYTDAAGDYAIEALAQGRGYRVQVLPQESPDPQVYDLIAEYYDDRISDANADPVAVPTDPLGDPVTVAGVDFELVLGASISGTVRDAVTSAALAGVWIDAHDFSLNHYAGGATADADGVYVIRGLAASSYRLQSHPYPLEYLGELYDDTYQHHLATAVAVPVTPAAGPPPVVADVDFGLAPSLSIAGRVTKDDGTAIAGLQVSASGQDVPFGANAYTAGDGTYRITRLGAGLYQVVAETGGTAFARAEQDADLSLGSAINVNFALGPGASIRGRIFEDVGGAAGYDAGEEEAGVRVNAYDFADGYWVAWAESDALGDYELSGLGAGSYRVETETDARNFVRLYYDASLRQDTATPVVIDAPGGDRNGIDFSLIRGFEVSGVVFFDSDGDGFHDAGEPGLDNVHVSANSADGALSAGTHTGPGGGYTLHGIYPAADYQIGAGPPQPLLGEYWQNVFFAEEATLVDTSGSSQSGIDFSLIDASTVGTLRGQVIGSDTLLGLPGVDVHVWRWDNGSGVASTTTDAGGDFVFVNLPPAPASGYKVFFDTQVSNVAENTDYVSSLWSQSGLPGVIDPNDLRVDFPTLPDPPGGAGSELGVFALDPGGSISGTVFPPSGHSLPESLGVSVQSFESGGRHLPGTGVDAGGFYHLRGLPAPATYRVQADAWGSEYVQVFYLSASESTFDQNTASAVQVAVDAETGGIDLHLFEGGSISGRVTRTSDGTAVVNMSIATDLVDDPLGRGFWQNTETDASGNYTLPGLPGGLYRVRTDGRDGDLANQRYPSDVPVTEGQDTPNVDFALAPAGRIHGRVTQIVDSVTEPVVNIRIEARDYDTREFLSDGHTDQNGDYTIGALPQGRDYRLQVATWDGQDPQLFNFIAEFYDDRQLWDEADRVPVPLDPGGNPVDVLGKDFQLELGGAVSGIVTGGGTPLQGVWVWTEDVAGFGLGNGDRTDHNGFYVIRGLPANLYRVIADPDPQDFVGEYYDDTTDQDLATPVTVQPVPAGGPIPITGNVNFELAVGFSVSGRVTEIDGGTPVPNLSVSANGIDVAHGAGTTTAADGTYEIKGLLAERYDVSADTDGTDFIRESREEDLGLGSLIEVDFALRLGAVLRGRVYDDTNGNDSYDDGVDAPQAGVEIYASEFFDGDGFGSGTSAADGTYEIRGLGAGSYRIELASDSHNFVTQYWDDTFLWHEATPAEVTQDGLGNPQDVAGIDFRVVPGNEIRGVVFFDADGDGEQGAGEPGLPDFGVSADDPNGFFNSWGNSETDGSYVIHGVFPGQSQVMVDAQGSPYASEIYRRVGGKAVGTYRWSEADLVDTSGGDETGIDFSLELGGGVTGTVRDSTTSLPIPGINVRANSFDGDGLWSGARTDSQGNYLMTGLPPGDYAVSTWDQEGVYVGEQHQDAVFWEDATPVHVLARLSVGDPLATLIDFDLDEGGVITGRVYNSASGLGIGGMDVSVDEFADPHRWLDNTQTDADGNYSLGGLPPGLDLRLSVLTNPSDFIAVVYDGGDDLGSTDWNDAAALQVTAGGTLLGTDVALVEGGSISGLVRDGDGVALADFWVNAGPITPGLSGAGAQAGVDGTYTISGLAAGDYRVSAGGDPYRYEYYDDRIDWQQAEAVTVTVGTPRTGVDFVLPIVPRILSGPSKASGKRDSTELGVTVVAEQLAGTPVLDFGAGVAVENLTFDAATGTFAFDLAIASDAALGEHSFSLVNDQLVEDGAAVLANAFEVTKAAVGDVPALSSERLYLADNGRSQLLVYGTADNSVLATIDVCCAADYTLISPDGNFLYQSGWNGTVSVTDLRLGAEGEEVARIPLAAFSLSGLAASDDFLYVVDRNYSAGEAVRVIDISTWTEVAQILVGPNHPDLKIDPAGATLWVLNRNIDTISLIDADPASPTVHTILSTVPLPAGTSPRGLAFTPDPADFRAWVVGRQDTYVLDPAAALSDPANAVLDVLSIQGAGSGAIDIASHAATGMDLAFVGTWGNVRVYDATLVAAPPNFLTSFEAGVYPAEIQATSDGAYIMHDGSLDFYAVDTQDLPTAASLPLVRFADSDPGGLATPGYQMAHGPIPGAPPAGAPQVAVASGSPALNGAPFSVTLSGSSLTLGSRVWLQDTQVEGAVTSATGTSLTADFPATTPTGDHRVVVTNFPGGPPESGVSTNLLLVDPPAGFSTSQEVYVSSFGGAQISVFESGVATAPIFPQPYPAGFSVTPDGHLGFVAQIYYGPQPSFEEDPPSIFDVTAIDLDPESPTYRKVVAVVPYALTSFLPPAITPALDDPDGVFVYVPGRFWFDAAAVIDPFTLAEVDTDGDPGTQTIPSWFLNPPPAPGITRIELDGEVYPSDRAANDTALTPDGSLLYVVNRTGSVSIVNTATYQVVGELTLGGQLTQPRHVAITPGGQGNPPIFVYVTGFDGAGQAFLFVFQAGIYDDSALVHQVALPERPAEIAISGDGNTVYLPLDFAGELRILDVSKVGNQQVGTETVTLAPGLSSAAEAADDLLLYVSNNRRGEVSVLDLSPGAGQYQVVTTLGARACPLFVTTQPALGTTKPVVGSVTPGSGDPAGGESVVISGANFQPDATVQFGGNPATVVAVDNDFTIRATTPASTLPGDGTGSVDVAVVNPDLKTGLLKNGFLYTIDSTAPSFTTPPYVASQALVGPPGAETATVEIRWTTDEASTSVVDYRRVGDPSFTPQADAALVTDHVVALTGLLSATDYELRATSADAKGNPASSPIAPATVPFTTPTAPDVEAPIILSGPTESTTTDSATIQWTTDEVSTSLVQFDAVVDGTPVDQVFGADATVHSVTLTGLVANTLYEYRVVSVDPSANRTATDVALFTTDALPDVTPPVLWSGPDVSYLSNDLVIVTWTTDELSTSFVNYGTASIDEQGVIDLDPVTSHVVFLTNLLPGTVYGFQVGSADANGNTVVSADPFGTVLLVSTAELTKDLTVGRVTLRSGAALVVTKAAAAFTTPALPDTTAPQVLSVEVVALSSDRVLVTVATDETASLLARYGVGGLGDSAFAPSFSAAPSLVLTGLAEATTYQLDVELTDPKGNTSSPPTSLSFTTPAAPDTLPPVLSGLLVTALSESSALVEWQTDEPSDSTVRFGAAGAALSSQTGLLGLRTEHAVLLSGLEPRTAYAFEAASRDTNGNVGTAAGTFTTLAPRPLVTSVTPPRAAQGTTVDVAINGEHFTAGAAVDFGSGVAVQGLGVNDRGTQIAVTIAVSATAAVGERTLTVTSAGGSAAAPFAIVDASPPIVTITEPDDGAALLTSTVLVRGTVDEPSAVVVNGVEATVAGSAFEATVPLIAGVNAIVASATDASGNRGTAVVTVTVVDSGPPVLTLAATPSVLWPPNHEMVTVAIDVQVTDDTDPSPQVVLVAVASNEPDDAPGGGDGATVDDVQDAELGTDDRQVQLRAERAGRGDGRVYTLTYRASDQAGHVVEESVEVVVPRDQG